MQGPQVQFTVTLPKGCTTVKLVRPDDGMEAVVEFPPIASAAEPQVPPLLPEVLDRLNRFLKYDPATHAKRVADGMVGEFGFQAMEPSKKNTDLRFVYVGTKGTATLWMNTTGLFSIAAGQTEFASTVHGGQPKPDGRVAFPFGAVEGLEVAAAFKKWADGETS